MLLNGITLDKADWIEWCDGIEDVEVERKWRRNVPKYRQVQGEPDRWEPDPNGMDTFSTPKGPMLNADGALFHRLFLSVPIRKIVLARLSE